MSNKKRAKARLRAVGAIGTLATLSGGLFAAAGDPPAFAMARAGWDCGGYGNACRSTAPLAKPKAVKAAKARTPRRVSRRVARPVVRFHDQRIVGGISTHSAAAAKAPQSYRLVGSSGGVYSFSAPGRGSLLGHRLGAPIVAAASTPDGKGYWLVSNDGGVFAFGDASYRGGLGHHHLGTPIVAISPTKTGHGYLLAGRDGGVFAFGDASYRGGLSHHHLGAPIVAISATSDGRGYWLFGGDGGVFTFGDASYLGSARRVSPPHHAAIHRVAAPSRVSTHRAAPAPGIYRGGYPVQYQSGLTGLDVSQYQCADMPPYHTGIAVVQVSGGQLDGPPNRCFKQQAKWAGANLSAYVFLDGLPNPLPREAIVGPAGYCPTDRVCQGYNFGWNWTKHWITYAQRSGAKPRLWWIDVETSGSWSDAASNQQVIMGALKALASSGLAAGIYSTPYQWPRIAGGLTLPGIPVWVPGAGNLSGAGYTATNFCIWQQGFARGHVKMVQFGYGGTFAGAYNGPRPYDLDLSC